jgi:hypothetical protein
MPRSPKSGELPTMAALKQTNVIEKRAATSVALPVSGAFRRMSAMPVTIRALLSSF